MPIYLNLNALFRRVRKAAKLSIIVTDAQAKGKLQIPVLCWMLWLYCVLCVTLPGLATFRHLHEFRLYLRLLQFEDFHSEPKTHRSSIISKEKFSF